MKVKTLCLLLALGGSPSCLAAPGPGGEELPAGGHHVLFIGNSLTYTNDLPATVAAIAQAAGDTFRVAMVAGPNLALIDHLNGATNAASRIREGGWEFVVLSQGPTTVGICRDSMVLWTHMFDDVIRPVGAKPALFMTWPASNAISRFDDVRISYQQAAAAVNGIFLPAGEAWRAAWAVDPTLALYGGDGFHPSPIGTFLAALEIYERLSGRDVRTLTPRAFSAGVEFALPVATIRVLQDAAHQANVAYPAAVPHDTPRPTPAKTGNLTC
jgi:hypothetical protein